MAKRYQANEAAVAAIRASLGMSQTKLAGKVGVHRSLIALLETGRSGVSDDVLERIAEALGVPVSAITYGAEVRRHPFDPQVLADLAALPKGWNGHGSDPITHEALATLTRFTLVPRAGGGLSLFYGDEDITIDIAADGSIESVYIDYEKASGPIPPPSPSGERRADQ